MFEVEKLELEKCPFCNGVLKKRNKGIKKHRRKNNETKR